MGLCLALVENLSLGPSSLCPHDREEGLEQINGMRQHRGAAWASVGASLETMAPQESWEQQPLLLPREVGCGAGLGPLFSSVSCHVDVASFSIEQRSGGSQLWWKTRRGSWWHPPQLLPRPSPGQSFLSPSLSPRPSSRTMCAPPQGWGLGCWGEEQGG